MGRAVSSFTRTNDGYGEERGILRDVVVKLLTRLHSVVIFLSLLLLIIPLWMGVPRSICTARRRGCLVLSHVWAVETAEAGGELLITAVGVMKDIPENHYVVPGLGDDLISFHKLEAQGLV
jgi:hypothetical protein